ncbi:hypothetical protein HN51_023797 [Arachis hypogaea]
MRQISAEEGAPAPKTFGSASDQSPANTRAPCFARPERVPCFARPVRTESDYSSSVVQPLAPVQGVEVPGVRINDIRVEVDDQKLSVKGRHSTSYLTIAGSPNASFSSYHKREILYGPCEVVWPLPSGVNKDHISAEFQDGFLQIIIPKI